MRKRIFFCATVVLAAAGALVSLSACGGNKADKAEAQEQTEQEQASVAEETPAEEEVVGNAAFFANEENKAEKATADKYAQTESGIKYVVLKEGTGKQPASAEDVVLVHYTGRLLDGKVFDSSVERGEPISFPLNRVIAGWTEGLQLMKEGGKTIFYLPSNLAYGESGTPDGSIPPNAPLIFEVELLEVNPK